MHVPIELWGGVEATVNRVGDRWFDQIVRSGHQNRLDDLDRFAALGLKALRVPVLWERVAPHSLSEPDWRWTDDRLERMRALGLRPIVGLVHHGSGPAYTSLVDERFPELLAQFAEMVARRYPWVTDYTPVNEPLTTARFSAMYGHWYPHDRSAAAFARALLLEIEATAAAMSAIRRATPDARLIQTEDAGTTFGTPATAIQTAHEGHRKWLTWDLLTGRVDQSHPLWGYLTGCGLAPDALLALVATPCPPAVLGLNYYVTSDRYLDDAFDRYPVSAHGGNGWMRYADVDAVRARREGIVGHEQQLLAAWRRYRIPVALTEVHLGCSREEQLRWLGEAWAGAHRARDAGAHVVAVTVWALLGSYDWDSLVTRPDGHYEPGAFDVRAPQPRPTAVARAVSQLATTGRMDHPVLDVPGWWRRPQRLVFGAGDLPVAPLDRSRPILIVGASSTLGGAFHRMCGLRGLPSRLVGRGELDICHPVQIDAALRRYDPWAVVNCAGYTRADDAERDSVGCHNANVIGAANLAAACRRRGLRFVTFSSDFVFDGALERPYTEDDLPRAVTTYGASTLEAERRVLTVLPSSMVVRSSALFGPWDDENFVTAMARVLTRGDEFAAPCDCVVTPTYVPHLVDATLDLLIDDEHGIWHVSNETALTWYDLARRAAAALGLPADLIVARPVREVWGPAERPRHAALMSVRARLMPTLDEAITAYASVIGESGALTDDKGATSCASW